MQKSTTPLETHERAFAAAASATLLGSSLVVARFPRLLAWPLALLGVLFGSIGVLRAVRLTFSKRSVESSPELSETDLL